MLTDEREDGDKGNVHETVAGDGACVIKPGTY
jgi:hypothetical protein